MHLITTLDPGLYLALAGVTIAGLSAVLGIWVERDTRRPPRYAIAISLLILLSTFVALGQSWLEHQQNQRLEEDIARMMEALDGLASQDGTNGEVRAFVGRELSALGRSNPRVVRRMSRRIQARGGDPDEVVGRYLKAADYERATGRKSKHGRKDKGDRKKPPGKKPERGASDER